MPLVDVSYFMQKDALIKDVVTAAKILHRKNLVEAFGHVSCRLSDDTYAITPTKSFYMLTSQDILIVTGGGRVLNGDQSWCPLEFPMHAAIYSARKDTNAICRTHSELACILGTLGKEIYPAHGFGAFLGDRVGVYHDIQLVTDDERAAHLVKELGDAEAMLIRGNGNIVLGADISSACVRAVYLEECARFLVYASPLGEPIRLTDEETVIRKQWIGVEMERAWRYLVNLVETNK